MYLQSCLLFSSDISCALPVPALASPPWICLWSVKAWGEEKSSGLWWWGVIAGYFVPLTQMEQLQTPHCPSPTSPTSNRRYRTTTTTFDDKADIHSSILILHAKLLGILFIYAYLLSIDHAISKSCCTERLQSLNNGAYYRHCVHSKVK